MQFIHINTSYCLIINIFQFRINQYMSFTISLIYIYLINNIIHSLILLHNSCNHNLKHILCFTSFILLHIILNIYKCHFHIIRSYSYQLSLYIHSYYFNQFIMKYKLLHNMMLHTFYLLLIISNILMSIMINIMLQNQFRCNNHCYHIMLNILFIHSKSYMFIKYIYLHNNYFKCIYHMQLYILLFNCFSDIMVFIHHHTLSYLLYKYVCYHHLLRKHMILHIIQFIHYKSFHHSYLYKLLHYNKHNCISFLNIKLHIHMTHVIF